LKLKKEILEGEFLELLEKKNLRELREKLKEIEETVEEEFEILGEDYDPEKKNKSSDCENGTCSLEPQTDKKGVSMTCDGNTCHLTASEDEEKKTEAPVGNFSDFIDDNK